MADTKTSDDGGWSWTWIVVILILILAIGGGAYYYFMVYAPRKALYDVATTALRATQQSVSAAADAAQQSVSAAADAAQQSVSAATRPKTQTLAEAVGAGYGYAPQRGGSMAEMVARSRVSGGSALGGMAAYWKKGAGCGCD